ncbi:MAG TPA: hypothetical protein VEA19_02945 [Actinomycetota bacterium]|nr:hypothetical protein [Actinomycetota bacterium]
MRWAIEDVPNPAVIRIHVDEELTTRTIESCPPAKPPDLLAPLLDIEGVRSLEPHRYRVRVNLSPGADVGEAVAEVMRHRAGAPHPLPQEELPRAFETPARRGRVVAESLEMAAGDPLAERLFRTEGVAEAIIGEGVTLIRLGRLFGWADLEAAVRDVLDP